MAFISGQESRRLQNANGGLSNGAGWTGERLWRNDPCLGGTIPSIPLDEALRSDPDIGAVADGEGTFFRIYVRK